MGAGIRLLHKGDLAKADIPAAAASRDLIITDGIGPDSFKALAAAKAVVGVYCKASGIRPGDAQWAAAQPLLWLDKGKPVQHMDQKWSYLDVQHKPKECAASVVIPYIRAALALAPSGLVSHIFIDNMTFQDVSLFLGGVYPSDWDRHAYHNGCLTVAAQVALAFPSMTIIVNGLCGGSEAGYRGEVYVTLPYVVYAESLYYKAGSPKLSTHFQADQAIVIALLNAGRGVIVEEPGVPLYSREWKMAFGIAVTTAGYSQHPEGMMFNVSGAPWSDWWR